MKILPLQWIVVLTICTALSAARADADAHALLIGINNYESESVPDLRGAVNDVALLRRVLVDRLGFPAENVRALLDKDADRRSIMDALADLAARVDTGDTVYVHFSGHGSQVKDQNGDEFDGLDETILPSDARTRGVPDITDDELEATFDTLAAKRQLIVFDSCHSGTITRSARLTSLATRHNLAPDALSNYRGRSVPRDERVDLYRVRSSAPVTREVVPVDELAHVLMTGAPAGEEALDGPVGDIWHGLFSYALGQTLNALGADASPVEVHDRVRSELRTLQAALSIRAPDPQLEGPSSYLNAPLLSEASDTPPLGDLVGSDKAKSYRLLDFDPALKQRISAYIAANLPEFSVGQDAARLIVSNAGASWTLHDGGNGARLASVDATDMELAMQELGAALRRSAQALDWLSLTNPETRIDLRVEVIDRAMASDGLAVRGITVRPVNDRPTFRIRRDGEARSAKNSLTIEVYSDTPGYLTIVHIDPNGETGLLFPNSYQNATFLPDGLIPAGERLRIPDSLSDSNRAGFHWDYAPPAGEDRLRLFLSTSKKHADRLRQAFSAQHNATMEDGLVDQTRVSDRGLVLVDGAAIEATADASDESDWAVSSVVLAVGPE